MEKITARRFSFKYMVMFLDGKRDLIQIIRNNITNVLYNYIKDVIHTLQPNLTRRIV